MRGILLQLASVSLLICLSATAQTTIVGDSSEQASVSTPNFRAGTVKGLTIYLTKVDGRWSASLSGDITDAATERLSVSLERGTARVWVNAHPPKTGNLCLTKMKDRAKFGYLDCNSAFYSSDKASTAAATLLRGVFSLGILTVTDAATGSTGFSVSLDQKALDEAITESKAIEFARESAPLVEYRTAYAVASSSTQLRSFIATYEGVFDPESLVAEAKAKLPIALEGENARANLQRAKAAQQAELQRQEEMKRQAEMEWLRLFQAGLRPGDRVMMKLQGGYDAYGMIIEMKSPLAYLQFENVTPMMQWVRVEGLLPPK